MKLRNWWINLLDKLPSPPQVELDLESMRHNLEARAPGGYREGARLMLSNAQCMQLLAALNKLEGK